MRQIVIDHLGHKCLELSGVKVRLIRVIITFSDENLSVESPEVSPMVEGH